MIKSINIQGRQVNFVLVQAQSMHYTIRWHDKPHRNVFRKQGVEHRELSITKDIWLQETLLSQDIWQSIMGENPSRFRDPQKPIEQISYIDVQQCIGRINAVGIGRVRLPFEDEFHLACLLNYPGGVEQYLQAAIWYEQNSLGQTHLCQSGQKGALGCYDLLGNLCQYVLPQQAVQSVDKICYKGASWATEAIWIDPDYTFYKPLQQRDATVGCRLVLEAD